jgi:hypothetical protein
VSTCTCGAEIEWAVTAAGNRIPLEPGPGAQAGFWDKKPEPPPPATLEGLRGKLVLLGGVVRPAVPEDVRLGRPLCETHFARCPHAAQHRKPRGIHG